MTRFLKLVRAGNGSWQALPPAEAKELESSTTPPVTTSLRKNAPIDPTQLLNALAPLLSSVGGINSIDKAPQFASLMKKFSRKLVSRCVYCNVLKATDKEILSRFLNEGGWNTINNWLNDAKNSENVCFIAELLELCKLLPMTVERLKENNTPKLVKSLTKFEHKEVRSLSEELILEWMKIIKGDNSTVAAVKLKKKKPALKEEVKEEKTSPKPLKKTNFVDKDKKDVKKPEKRKEIDSSKTENSETPPKRSKLGASKSENVAPKTAKTSGKPNIKKELHPPKGSKESSVLNKSVKETPIVNKKLKDTSSAGKTSKEPTPVQKSSKDKVLPKTVKEPSSKQSPPVLRTQKRTSSESKDVSASENSDDTKSKIDSEPVIKRPKTDRPKTVKAFQTKFRATGLEEEIPLPKKVTKKTPTVDKTTAAAVLAKTTSVKKLTTTFPDRITEKKIKPENLAKIDENALTPAGGIKLIPAKPQPAIHILHESASFVDALTAQALPPIKRKKKAANKPNTTPPTTPTSPPSTMKAPKLEFYKDTLEMNSEESTKKEDEKQNVDSKSNDEISPSSPDKDDETSGNTEKKDDKDVSSEDSSQKSESKDDEDRAETGSGTPVQEEEQEEKSKNPNEIKSILAHGKRRLKRKTVKWVDDDSLKKIHYFELDETERVNVLRNRPFGDLKSIEAKRERELFEAARRHAGDKMEEAIPWWTTPILIDCPPPLVEPGIYSQEREIQHLRQQSILQEIYFNREMLPDSPQEPDPESVPFQEPKIIPLDEENTGPMMDYSGQEIPKPKTTLPEVLSTLIKMTTSRPLLPEPLLQQQQPVPQYMQSPPMSQANMNPAMMQPSHQMNMHSSPASPFEVDEPVHPGLLGNDPSHIPPMGPGGGGPPMFNAPPIGEPHRMPMPNNNNNWRPPADSNMMLGDQQFFGNFPPPVNPVMDMGPPSHMPRNMRPRMPTGPMMGGGGGGSGGDMYRPGGPKGSHFRPGGPRRGGPRVPCRHFISGGCRFGINCNFLHPGVNGPPL